MTSELDYLVVSAHPDDAELGMGGTLALLKEEGASVGILDLTDGEPTPRGSQEIRAQETAAASEVLKLDYRASLGLKNRELTDDLPSRTILAEAFRKIRPRRLFFPHWEDNHPDHVTACRLAEGARFWSKLTRSQLAGEPWFPARVFYYFGVHLRIHPKPSFVVDISRFMEIKMQAIACYHSQVIAGRSQEYPTFLDDVRDRSRYWGWSIGCPHGEPFLSREETGLRSLKDLI
ncbi:MAG: bacillithiol biosynthesis deacetylase BshB1 [Gemmataceae bacterium]|nr:bacillithiol biosynthesis deacetylase BshB1 [Gemmataceae bacterium]